MLIIYDILSYLFIMQKVGGCDFFLWAENESLTERVKDVEKRMHDEICRLEEEMVRREVEMHAEMGRFEKKMECREAEMRAEIGRLGKEIVCLFFVN